MDYVEGLGLESVLRSGGPLAEEAVVAIARQICRALAAAHASGAVHGSLAPRHILIGFDGVLRVGDFTIARVERRLRGGRGTAPEAARASTSSEIPQLAGATVGAPEYMSPEQLIGERPTPQTDLYAAGVVLYECVTGATPFRTDSPLAFLAQKLGDADSLVSTSELRASRPLRGATAHVLNDVIARMLAPDTAKRAASASALLELLQVPVLREGNVIVCRFTYAFPVRINTSSESFEIVVVFVDVNVPLSVPLAGAPAASLNGTMTLALVPVAAGPWM